MFYYKDIIFNTEKKVLAVRLVDLINYHPSVHNWLIKTKFTEKYIQVLVEITGGNSWINIHKNQLYIRE